MDSHEEKVFQAVRETQEKEAKQKMREKAKELQRQRMESQKKGMPMGRGFGSSSDSFGVSSSSMSSSTPSIGISEIAKPAPTISKASAPKNALKLGGKSRDVDTFVDQLKSEGEKVTNLTPTVTSSAASSAPARVKSEVPMDE